MNTYTGGLVTAEAMSQMTSDERAKHIEVRRDLTKLEEANMKIKLYSACGCGSGKKFKFCCFRKADSQ